jgi:acid phosphatase
VNDAHDTGIVYGADWLYQFLEPILENKNFMNNTLLIISKLNSPHPEFKLTPPDFDEDETYTIGNRVMSILLSDIMPTSLVNTTDDTFYTHYSVIASIEANWDLHHLGRWDTHANVLKIVANATGDIIRTPDLTNVFFNQSYPGAFAATYWGPMPAPNVSAVVNGRTIFGEVLTQWSNVSSLFLGSGRIKLIGNSSKIVHTTPTRKFLLMAYVFLSLSQLLAGR